MKFSKTEKKQLIIYASVAFGITYILGLLMWYGYTAEKSLIVFPNAQMFYPAAGVMVMLIATQKRKELPLPFFISYLIITGLLIVSAVASVFQTDKNAALYPEICNILIIAGSIICGIFLLVGKKEKKITWGLSGKNWKLSWICIVLFFMLYILRVVVSCLFAGDMNGLQEIVKLLINPITWGMICSLAVNFFLTYLAFFGEEYGWRYYLQPMLQKRYGKRIGVIILGVVWGLWHLPLDFFYYTSPEMGLEQTAVQLITCIFLGIFFAYAYMKTENIWVPVILHYMNNSLIMVFSGNYTEEVLENQIIRWEDVLPYLLINIVIYGGFLLSKEFKSSK